MAFGSNLWYGVVRIPCTLTTAYRSLLSQNHGRRNGGNMKQPLYWKDERLRHAAVLFVETPLDRKRVIRCLLDSLYAVAQQKNVPSAA